MKHKYKVLMYGNVFVDIVQIHKGIYQTKNPQLFPADMTIPQLARSYDGFEPMLPTKEYINNLNKCELREVELRVLDN